jgi:hypothetical protein
VEGNNSDKCKEKINNLGSELEIEFAKLSNKYKVDALDNKEIGGSKVDLKDEYTKMSDSNGLSDSTFEGFSD